MLSPATVCGLTSLYSLSVQNHIYVKRIYQYFQWLFCSCSSARFGKQLLCWIHCFHSFEMVNFLVNIVLVFSGLLLHLEPVILEGCNWRLRGLALSVTVSCKLIIMKTQFRLFFSWCAASLLCWNCLLPLSLSLNIFLGFSEAQVLAWHLRVHADKSLCTCLQQYIWNLF